MLLPGTLGSGWSKITVTLPAGRSAAMALVIVKAAKAAARKYRVNMRNSSGGGGHGRPPGGLLACGLVQRAGEPVLEADGAQARGMAGGQRLVVELGTEVA